MAGGVDPELVGQQTPALFFFFSPVPAYVGEALLEKCELQRVKTVISGLKRSFLLSSQSHRMCGDEAQLGSSWEREWRRWEDGVGLDPLPPLGASLVGVRQNQGCVKVGGRCSLWTHKDAGPFCPLLFLLLPPILSSSSSLPFPLLSLLFLL